MAVRDQRNPEDSRRHWSTVGHFALRIVLMILIFFQVNYLGCRHYGTIDMSRNRKFSLSDQTAGFLRELGGKVQIVTAFLGTSDALHLRIFIRPPTNLIRRDTPAIVFHH